MIGIPGGADHILSDFIAKDAILSVEPAVQKMDEEVTVRVTHDIPVLPHGDINGFRAGHPAYGSVIAATQPVF